jgi:hypothetical protein
MPCNIYQLNYLIPALELVHSQYLREQRKYKTYGEFCSDLNHVLALLKGTNHALNPSSVF